MAVTTLRGEIPCHPFTTGWFRYHLEAIACHSPPKSTSTMIQNRGETSRKVQFGKELKHITERVGGGKCFEVRV